MNHQGKIDILLSRAVQDFLKENPHTEPAAFLLNPPPHVREHALLVAEQLASRAKAKKKLPEWYDREGILWPPPLSMEQSSSALTSSYKGSLLKGNHLVDLTGGMGIDCLALSDHFLKTTYVERESWLCEVFAHNAKVLGKQVDVFRGDAVEYLRQFEGTATFFIDPARRDEARKKVFLLEDCSPNLNEILPSLNQKSSETLIKLSPMLDITAGIRALQPAEVHVIAINNECKELLFMLRTGHHDEPQIICSYHTGGLWQKFEFRLKDEQQTTANFSSALTYLYDANAAVMKAGAFLTVAEKYNLYKLAPNTHLYTSDALLKDFPGRAFAIQALDISSKNLRQILPGGKAHVLVRNYPIGAEQLKKQLKLQEGGDAFVIGYRDAMGKAKIVLAQLIIS